MVVVLASWLVAASALMFVFHLFVQRGRQETRVPDEVQAFLADLRDDLESHHPGVEFRGLIPGRFAAVLSLRGQEVPVSLHDLHRRHRAFPTSFSKLVREFVADTQERGLEQAWQHSFADVATTILPQIRNRSWLRERGSVFGSGALVHRDLTEDLVICYVIDDPWCMTFVCQEHLQQWGHSEQAIYHLATRNLHVLAGSDLPMPDPEDDGVLVKTGDGFDAARVLLLDRDNVEGLLVGMPERDVLWLGTEEGQGLSGLMSRNEKQSQHASHPVSPHLYRVTDGELVPVRATGSAG